MLAEPSHTTRIVKMRYYTFCLDIFNGPNLTLSNTAKTTCRIFETNIPRKGISGPQSQFPHSCVCEQIIYSLDGSAFSAGENMWTAWEYINRSQTHEVEIGAKAAQFPEKEYINRIAVAAYLLKESF